MNVVDFLSLANIPLLNSKGDIKRLIKNNGLSIDMVKCKINDEYKNYEYVKCLTLEDFLTDYYRINQNEKILHNCLWEFGCVMNFKENELIDSALDDIFIFFKGKKEKYVLICFEEFYSDSMLEDMMYEMTNHYKLNGSSHYTNESDEKIFETYYDKSLDNLITNLDLENVLEEDIEKIEEIYIERVNNLF